MHDSLATRLVKVLESLRSKLILKSRRGGGGGQKWFADIQ